VKCLPGLVVPVGRGLCPRRAGGGSRQLFDPPDALPQTISDSSPRSTTQPADCSWATSSGDDPPRAGARGNAAGGSGPSTRSCGRPAHIPLRAKTPGGITQRERKAMTSQLMTAPAASDHRRPGRTKAPARVANLLRRSHGDPAASGRCPAQIQQRAEPMVVTSTTRWRHAADSCRCAGHLHPLRPSGEVQPQLAGSSRPRHKPNHD